MVKTYAFFDNASNTTFCTEDLMEQLKTRGKDTTLRITADVELSEQCEKYCNMEFNNSYYDTKVTMFQEEKKTLQKMKSSIQLKRNLSPVERRMSSSSQ